MVDTVLLDHLALMVNVALLDDLEIPDETVGGETLDRPARR